eukprot:1160735-Pelagomonas_calceolata.AAC.8
MVFRLNAQWPACPTPLLWPTARAVFCMHNRDRVEVFCYALSPNDGSQWRQRIEAGTEHFIDASSWGTGEVRACMCACVCVHQSRH